MSIDPAEKALSALEEALVSHGINARRVPENDGISLSYERMMNGQYLARVYMDSGLHFAGVVDQREKAIIRAHAALYYGLVSWGSSVYLAQS